MPADRNLPTPEIELTMKLINGKENVPFVKLICDVISLQQTLKVKM